VADGANDVFINCPFDETYRPLFLAMVFGIHALGFRARCALEIDDGGVTRLSKIEGLISDCRFGVHDLSRIELDDANGLPRFNMPFELGLFLGAKHYGDEVQQRKQILVLDVERYRFQQFISDLAGVDPKAHDGEPEKLLAALRLFLRTASQRSVIGLGELTELYHAWVDDLSPAAEAFGYTPTDLPYPDLLHDIGYWMIRH
jgi:hypothetical protein